MSEEIKFALSLDTASFVKGCSQAVTTATQTSIQLTVMGQSMEAPDTRLKNLATSNQLFAFAARNAAAAASLFGNNLATRVVAGASAAGRELTELAEIIAKNPMFAARFGLAGLAVGGALAIGTTAYQAGEAKLGEQNSIASLDGATAQTGARLRTIIEKGVKDGIYTGAQQSQWVKALFSGSTTAEFADNLRRVQREVRANTMDKATQEELANLKQSLSLNALTGPEQTIKRADAAHQATTARLKEIEAGPGGGASNTLYGAMSAADRVQGGVYEAVRGEFRQMKDALRIDALPDDQRRQAQIEQQYQKTLERISGFEKAGVLQGTLRGEFTEARQSALRLRDKALADIEKQAETPKEEEPAAPKAARDFAPRQVTAVERMGFVFNGGGGSGVDHNQSTAENTRQLVDLNKQLLRKLSPAPGGSGKDFGNL